MEFSRDRYVMLIMRSRKIQLTKGIKLSNQKNIRTFGENGNLQVFGNIASGHSQTSGDERKHFLKHHRTRKLLETKLHGRNFIKEINTWAVLLVLSSGPFLLLYIPYRWTLMHMCHSLWRHWTLLRGERLMLIKLSPLGAGTSFPLQANIVFC